MMGWLYASYQPNTFVIATSRIVAFGIIAAR